MFAESVSDKRSVVLAAEHWIHLRTTNDGIDLRHRTVENQSHQKAQLPGGRTGHGDNLIVAAHHAGAPSTHRTWSSPSSEPAAIHKGKLLERPVDITPHPPTTEPETVGSEVTWNAPIHRY